MRITIIPHSTSEVKSLHVNKFLVVSLLLFLVLISFLGKYLYTHKSFDISRLIKKNKYLEEELGDLNKEYAKLENKYDDLSTQVQQVRAVIPFESAVQVLSKRKTLDELLLDLQNSKALLKAVELKIQSDASLANYTPSILPIAGYIIKTFGPTQDIFTGESRFCQGIDISAPKGSKVYATANGTVKLAGSRRHKGLTVVINHGSGFETHYSHLSFLRVRKYQRVKRGDIVGFVGTTGKTVGPVLHYEVWFDGEPQDPLTYILEGVRFF